MATVGSSIIGAGDNGLYLIRPGIPADGMPIDAFFDITADLGRICRLRFLFISGEFAGKVKIVLSADDGPEKTYTVSPRFTGNREHNFKIPVRRDQGQGRYWRFRIGNADGSDFSVDSISVLPVLRAGER